LQEEIVHDVGDLAVDATKVLEIQNGRINNLESALYDIVKVMEVNLTACDENPESFKRLHQFSAQLDMFRQGKQKHVYEYGKL